MAENLPTSPRLIKTHFPVQFVPKSFWEQNCKVRGLCVICTISEYSERMLCTLYKVASAALRTHSAGVGNTGKITLRAGEILNLQLKESRLLLTGLSVFLLIQWIA